MLSMLSRNFLRTGLCIRKCPTVLNYKKEKTSYLLHNAIQHERMLWTRLFSFWGSQNPSDWKNAVSDAEKLVGYPTSFMSLRCLLSDELSNVALHMRKLVGTKHPLLKTARKFLYDGKHSLQTRGLLILLMSKAAGQGVQNPAKLEQMVSGIYPSQRTLAEVVEMIHTANLIHTGVVNLADVQSSDGSLSDMEFGNKIAVLSGDFLLANASTGLAGLENTKVVELISSAIGDLMEAEFSLLRNKMGFPMWPEAGYTFSDWQWLVYKGMGALIAKSCKAALMLAGHCEEVQEHAYNLGKNIAYAHQLHDDLMGILRQSEDTSQISMLSAPVILHMEESPLSPLTLQLQKDGWLDAEHTREMLKNSPAIEKCKALCQEYGDNALKALDNFPQSDAHIALKKIIKAAIHFK